MELGPRIIFSIGDLHITETVVFGWIISLIIIVLALAVTRDLKRIPKGPQLLAELLVDLIYKMVTETMGKAGERFAPYFGTLMVFLFFGSILGMLDLRPVTADLNMVAPLALVSFCIIHYNSIKARTLGGYLKHMASPYAFMFPMNLMSECMFPVTLAFRIFGNITAGVIVMTLFYGALREFSEMLGLGIPLLQLALPLPLNLFFDMFEPALQAYIFTMLTMVFTSNGMDTEE